MCLFFPGWLIFCLRSLRLSCFRCFKIMRCSVVAAAALGFVGGALWGGGGLHASHPPMEVGEEEGVARLVRFGFPGLDTVRSRKSYVLSYDRRNRVPHWVIEHLTPQQVVRDASVSRAKSEFFEDASVHPFFRATHADYRGSGFDRGHLAAAGNHAHSQDALDDTFVLSNVAPQVGKGFNRDTWNRLEKYVRKKARQHKNTYVCTGPLYLPRFEEDGKKYVKYRVIGPHDVAVPTHFFKAVLCEREGDALFELETFVLPNAPIDDDVPLSAFLVPRDVVERAAGLLLFEKLPDAAFHRINGHRVTK
ncbi:hypothetical protein JTE90_007367 [Oedothorax gibbosus]|uniref:Endonuclease n=1 Tax=Oedothorax gibbosus TaxID=931172 RepID=A0AAV6U532_9ARAC|nr:hypothetical protein JTE90_007367 [Oedothorax gibbosus]